MRNKTMFFLACLILAFAAATAGARRSGTDAEVVIRQQPNGEWQMFVFGPPCASAQNMQVIYPKDKTQPIEIECDNTKRGRSE
jgi:hypothetical protein